MSQSTGQQGHSGAQRGPCWGWKPRGRSGGPGCAGASGVADPHAAPVRPVFSGGRVQLGPQRCAVVG